VAFEHTDTEHQHIHLAISRIRADGKVIPTPGILGGRKPSADD